MAITDDSPISALKLSKHLTDDLTRRNISTVGHLVRHSHEYYVSLLTRQWLDELDAAIAKHSLKLPHPSGIRQVCTACPACPDCGNPRAREAKQVVTDYRGRQKHVGFVETEPCDGCNAYHRELTGATT